MTHLSDEQFEAVLHGEISAPPHLTECPACRARLAEMRAVGERLRAAFESVHAPAGLAERVRAQAQSAGAAPAPEAVAWRPSRPGTSGLIHRVPRWAWAGLAAVVLLAAGLPLALVLTPRSAAAELVRIHEHNLAGGHEFYGDSDPAKLADYFKKNLGFQPAMPELGHGMKIRGCCIEHFRGAPVGSYVVDTPQGVISVIVVNDPPESFAKSQPMPRDGQTLWASDFGHCHMVSVRLGGYTYFAVGDHNVAHDVLADLLMRLLAAEH